MATRTTLKLPTSFPIGKTTISLDHDDIATLEAFINGLQAGILTYEVYGKKAHLSDTDIITLFVQQQKSLLHSSPFNAGCIIGVISTLTQKGTYQMTDASFCEGYQEGIQAYCRIGHQHVFTLSELCCLVAWKHQGNSCWFNAGYVSGFIKGLTQGIHAILTLGRGTK